MKIIKKMLKKCSRVLSDELYLKIKYRQSLGKKLNLKSPCTFNEKIQWLKLYNRQPEFTKMVDKHTVKEIVSAKIGSEYIVPELGIYDSFEQIDFDKLPNQFVLKTIHDCGGVIICKNKKNFNYDEAKKKLNRHMKNNYYYQAREWPYKNVPHKILAEELIDDGGAILIVYKVFCFKGEPYIIQVIQDDKTKKESVDYFDIKWNLLKLRQNYANSKNHIVQPKVLNKMVELSKKLSTGSPFIRIDWYVVDDRLIFSEFTFYSDAGFAAFFPEKWDYELGKMIQL